MRLRRTVVLAAVVTSSAVVATSVAQPANPEFATDRILVEVLPGVQPQSLQDGRMSFRYVAQIDLPQEEVAAAESAMADAIEQWAVSSVDPMIPFPLQDQALARETGLDRLYIVRVPEGTDVAAMVEQFVPCDTHLEFASVSRYGHFNGQPPNDPFFDDQWGLGNPAEPIGFCCFGLPVHCHDGTFDCQDPTCQELFPGCPCLGAEVPPGIEGADINVLDAWTLETGIPAVIVAVPDTGVTWTTRIWTTNSSPVITSSRGKMRTSLKTLVSERTEYSSPASSGPKPTMPRGSPG